MNYFNRMSLTTLFIVLIVITGHVYSQSEKEMNNLSDRSKKLSKATFAGGCFWCMEPPFDVLEGVVSTTSGYIGGDVPNPTYEAVTTGTTGHAEAVEVIFDPAIVSYAELVEVFWRNIDPTTENRQFADRGSQYRTAIFYHNEAQKETAENSKKKLAESGKFDKDIVTEIVPATQFYIAEEYHQDYYRKNTIHYKMYRKGSGRESYLDETWGDESKK